jgi:PleD family two-component response regulator
MELKRPVVLIVDDVLMNIEILSQALGSEYEILFAMSGQEGLDIARSQHPDLILLDIMMPETDGYDVCVQLKADGTTNVIPIIFVTALSGEEDEAQGLEIGAIDYITKPFSPTIVRARVKNHLKLRRVEQQREKLILELEDAISKVRTLTGLIPICSSCKNIRNDEGYWTLLETYLEEHSDAAFSHGICPKCAQKLYPEYYKPL